MRIEEKEIKVMRPVYIAEDGVEFVDKDECEAYECKLLEKTLKLYNEKCEPCDIDENKYANLITDADVENFKRCCEWYGITSKGIDEPALYMFDESYRTDCWVNLDDVCVRIRGGLENDVGEKTYE